MRSTKQKIWDTGVRLHTFNNNHIFLADLLREDAVAAVVVAVAAVVVV
jgi:hypothetical protein